jgi:hypothetical protein
MIARAACRCDDFGVTAGVPQIVAVLMQRAKRQPRAIRTSLHATTVEELSLGCFVNCGGLRKALQDRPLDVAHVRASCNANGSRWAISG